MRGFRTILSVTLALMLASFLPLLAGGPNDDCHFNPDSLQLVTVSGVAIVDTISDGHYLYYLDENLDGQADYFLNFGPYWYQPDSSAATRPADGDTITVYGGLHEPVFNEGELPVIVVYEIDGQYWREPFHPFWSNMGRHFGHYLRNKFHYAFGWLKDSLETVNLHGVAMVDSTFMFDHYFLDTDEDGTPDYMLNFGPPWYEPESGATRPADGDTIDIVGGELPFGSLDMVIVYEIDGLAWRDSSCFGPNFGGQWIHRNMMTGRYFHAAWDSLSGIRVNPGWHLNLGPIGDMLPDSLFCQMLQLYPENMPDGGKQSAFAGFEIGVFGPRGNNLMAMSGMMGGQLKFNNQVQVRFRFTNQQVEGMNRNSIQVKAWNSETETWETVPDASINTADNTVSFSSTELSSFYILTSEANATSVTGEKTQISEAFTLEQNYPNPFNPTTNISFQLSSAAQVRLAIYNVLGQKVAELVNGKLNSGSYSYELNAANLSSGIYFYELSVNGNSKIRKMNLIR